MVQHFIQIIVLLVFASWGLCKLVSTFCELLKDPVIQAAIISFLPKKKNLASSLATQRDYRSNVAFFRG